MNFFGPLLVLGIFFSWSSYATVGGATRLLHQWAFAFVLVRCLQRRFRAQIQYTRDHLPERPGSSAQTCRCGQQDSAEDIAPALPVALVCQTYEASTLLLLRLLLQIMP